MNWGKSIVLAFVLFAAFIGTLVTVCIRQDVSLVSKDYYQEELVYQQQIDRENNTRALAVKPAIFVEQGAVRIEFSQLSQLDQGSLTLFCPANARLDKQFQLSRTTETSAVLPTGNMQPGMYKAQMRWRMEDKEYYFEQIIYI